MLHSINKKLEAKVETLEHKVDANEQSTKLKNIEIKGIPYKNGENTDDICQKLLNTLNEESINTNEFESCYRRHIKKDQSNIIIKLKNTSIKNLIIKEAKKKNLTTKNLGFQCNSRIFINEELTAFRKELFYLALQKKKELNWKFIWSTNGQILMRKSENSKIIPISNKKDLEKLD